MVYIHSKILPITQTTINENARKWLKVINYGESGVVIQIQDDCEYRIKEVISDKKILSNILGRYYNKFILFFIQADTKNVCITLKETLIKEAVKRKIISSKKIVGYSLEELITYITDKGYELGLFISRIDHLVNEPNYPSLLSLEHILQNTHNCSILLFFNTDITHPRFRFLIDKCSLLFDQVFFYPLYKKEDSLQFIRYQEDMWLMKITEIQKQEIISLCGGYLWLISHVQRFLRDNPGKKVSDVTSDTLLLTKLDAIWDKFTKEEKDILKKTATQSLKESDMHSHEYRYLKTIGVIVETSGKLRLGIPFLKLVIQKENQLDNWQVENDKIIINHVDVTNSLSDNEYKLLFLLITHKKKIVSREQIARSLWGKEWEEKYSDWAIDRLAYRLRKTLILQEFDSSFIKTIKRKGIMFG